MPQVLFFRRNYIDDLKPFANFLLFFKNLFIYHQNSQCE